MFILYLVILHYSRKRSGALSLILPFSKVDLCCKCFAANREVIQTAAEVESLVCSAAKGSQNAGIAHNGTYPYNVRQNLKISEVSHFFA